MHHRRFTHRTRGAPCALPPLLQEPRHSPLVCCQRPVCPVTCSDGGNANAIADVHRSSHDFLVSAVGKSSSLGSVSRGAGALAATPLCLRPYDPFSDFPATDTYASSGFGGGYDELSGGEAGQGPWRCDVCGDVNAAGCLACHGCGAHPPSTSPPPASPSPSAEAAVGLCRWRSGSGTPLRPNDGNLDTSSADPSVFRDNATTVERHSPRTTSDSFTARDGASSRASPPPPSSHQQRRRRQDHGNHSQQAPQSALPSRTSLTWGCPRCDHQHELPIPMLQRKMKAEREGQSGNKNNRSSGRRPRDETIKCSGCHKAYGAIDVFVTATEQQRRQGQHQQHQRGQAHGREPGSRHRRHDSRSSASATSTTVDPSPGSHHPPRPRHAQDSRTAQKNESYDTNRASTARPAADAASRWSTPVSAAVGTQGTGDMEDEQSAATPHTKTSRTIEPPAAAHHGAALTAWSCVACGVANDGAAERCTLCNVGTRPVVPETEMASLSAEAARHRGGGPSTPTTPASSSAPEAAPAQPPQQTLRGDDAAARGSSEQDVASGSAEENQSAPSPWRCPSCTFLNYAKRKTCRRCSAPCPAAVPFRHGAVSALHVPSDIHLRGGGGHASCGGPCNVDAAADSAAEGAKVPTAAAGHEAELRDEGGSTHQQVLSSALQGQWSCDVCGGANTQEMSRRVYYSLFVRGREHDPTRSSSAETDDGSAARRPPPALTAAELGYLAAHHPDARSFCVRCHTPAKVAHAALWFCSSPVCMTQARREYLTAIGAHGGPAQSSSSASSFAANQSANQSPPSPLLRISASRAAEVTASAHLPRSDDAEEGTCNSSGGAATDAGSNLNGNSSGNGSSDLKDGGQCSGGGSHDDTALYFPSFVHHVSHFGTWNHTTRATCLQCHGPRPTGPPPLSPTTRLLLQDRSLFFADPPPPEDARWVPAKSQDDASTTEASETSAGTTSMPNTSNTAGAKAAGGGLDETRSPPELSEQQTMFDTILTPAATAIHYAYRWQCAVCGSVENTAADPTCVACGLGNTRYPGDWHCAACGDLNFARRTTCRRCAAPAARRWVELVSPAVHNAYLAACAARAARMTPQPSATPTAEPHHDDRQLTIDEAVARSDTTMAPSPAAGTAARAEGPAGGPAAKRKAAHLFATQQSVGLGLCINRVTTQRTIARGEVEAAASNRATFSAGARPDQSELFDFLLDPTHQHVPDGSAAAHGAVDGGDGRAVPHPSMFGQAVAAGALLSDGQRGVRQAAEQRRRREAQAPLSDTEAMLLAEIERMARDTAQATAADMPPSPPSRGMASAQPRDSEKGVEKPGPGFHGGMAVDDAASSTMTKGKVPVARPQSALDALGAELDALVHGDSSSPNVDGAPASSPGAFNIGTSNFEAGDGDKAGAQITAAQEVTATLDAFLASANADLEAPASTSDTLERSDGGASGNTTEGIKAGKAQEPFGADAAFAAVQQDLAEREHRRLLAAPFALTSPLFADSSSAPASTPSSGEANRYPSPSDSGRPSSPPRSMLRLLDEFTGRLPCDMDEFRRVVPATAQHRAAAPRVAATPDVATGVAGASGAAGAKSAGARGASKSARWVLATPAPADAAPESSEAVSFDESPLLRDAVAASRQDTAAFTIGHPPSGDVSLLPIAEPAVLPTAVRQQLSTAEAALVRHVDETEHLSAAGDGQHREGRYSLAHEPDSSHDRRDGTSVGAGGAGSAVSLLFNGGWDLVLVGSDGGDANMDASSRSVEGRKHEPPTSTSPGLGPADAQDDAFLDAPLAAAMAALPSSDEEPALWQCIVCGGSVLAVFGECSVCGAARPRVVSDEEYEAEMDRIAAEEQRAEAAAEAARAAVDLGDDV